ncbi:MAG: EF2563 family selenium-dependent molybdenum hydroxylase system protein [Desulfobacteraceae bacterium]|nr:MAG: EF2563 family selenium-dependent molybdenum hydroxylase system protein [Desulfobacteraceae bacterium]
MVVLIRGGGDIGTGIGWRLHQCGFRLLITEIAQPLAVRRKVSFCEAVYDGCAEVEGVKATLVDAPEGTEAAWNRGEIPLMIDPECHARSVLKPQVVVDAVLAKRNLGTAIHDAPLVIAVGPGFEAGKDCHFVVETNRGHHLGRLLLSGSAEPNTGIPGPVMGITQDRVLRAPAGGKWHSEMDIGAFVTPGDLIGSVKGKAVEAKIGGVIRGLIRQGVHVEPGMKIGDIDPRGRPEYCNTISEKALAIAGGVLEGILRFRKLQDNESP